MLNDSEPVRTTEETTLKRGPSLEITCREFHSKKWIMSWNVCVLLFPSFTIFIKTQNFKTGIHFCLVCWFLWNTLRGTQEFPGRDSLGRCWWGSPGCQEHGVLCSSPKNFYCVYFVLEVSVYKFVWGKFLNFELENIPYLLFRSRSFIFIDEGNFKWLVPCQTTIDALAAS